MAIKKVSPIHRYESVPEETPVKKGRAKVTVIERKLTVLQKVGMVARSICYLTTAAAVVVVVVFYRTGLHPFMTVESAEVFRRLNIFEQHITDFSVSVAKVSDRVDDFSDTVQGDYSEFKKALNKKVDKKG